MLVCQGSDMGRSLKPLGVGPLGVQHVEPAVTVCLPAQGMEWRGAQRDCVSACQMSKTGKSPACLGVYLPRIWKEGQLGTTGYRPAETLDQEVA